MSTAFKRYSTSLCTVSTNTLTEIFFFLISCSTYIQPSLVPALNSRLVSRDIDKEKINSLTKRELEVLIEVANGLFNKEIATSLNISERTVKNHISNIFKKIDVSDRTQAAVFAIKNNLIKLYQSPANLCRHLPTAGSLSIFLIQGLLIQLHCQSFLQPEIHFQIFSKICLSILSHYH